MNGVQDNYSLQDIVTRVNGDDFIPHGETMYDEGAYDRQLAIENLMDWLIDGMRYVYEFRNRVEYSYQKAGKEAERYLREVKDKIEDMMDDESEEEDEQG